MKFGSLLLVGPAAMPQPARLMFALRVVVGPVQDAAAVVPLVNPVELDHVAHCQRVNARREVDVVRDQQRLVRVEAQDEALVTAAVVIVVEQARNRALAGYLQAARLVRVGLGDQIRASLGRRCGSSPGPRATPNGLRAIPSAGG